MLLGPDFQGRSQRGGGAGGRVPPDGKTFLKISHKNRAIQEKWKEIGKIVGSLPLRMERLATAQQIAMKQRSMFSVHSSSPSEKQSKLFDLQN